jgi:hypothetical protein
MRPLPMAFWTVLTETPRWRAYALWLIAGMRLFPKITLAFPGHRSDESSCADQPPKG